MSCGSTRTLSYGIERGWIGRDFEGDDGVPVTMVVAGYEFHLGAKRRHEETLVEARKVVRATNALVDAWLVAQEEERARHKAEMALAKERHEATIEAHRIEDEQRKAVAKREGKLWELLFQVTGGLAAAFLAFVGVKKVRKHRAKANGAEENVEGDG